MITTRNALLLSFLIHGVQEKLCLFKAMRLGGRVGKLLRILLNKTKYLMNTLYLLVIYQLSLNAGEFIKPISSLIPSLPD